MSEPVQTTLPIDEPRLAKWLGIARETKQEAAKDRITGLGAEVAFFAVLSVFPGLLMVTAALGHLELLVGTELAARSQAEILRFLNLILTDQAAGAVGEVEALFQEGRPGVLTAAGAAAVWALGRGFAAVIRSLNLAYDTPEARSWIRQRLTALALSVGAVLIGAVAVAMVVVGPFLGRGEAVADAVGAGGAFSTAWTWFRWPTAFFVMVAGATVLYHFAPNRPKCAWKEDVPGAVVAATLWLVVSAGFSLYLRLAPGANAILGALGGGLIVLVWLYLLSVSLLLGGELNGVLSRRAGCIDPR